MLPHMPDILAAVKAELDRREWSRYRLAEAVKGRVSPGVVYRFLSGYRKITHVMLGHILDALELEIRRRKT